MSREPGGFRSRANGSGGYTNGYGSREGGYGGFGAAEDDYPRRPSADRPRPSAERPSGERRRRPGGYGGYGGFSQEEEEAPQVQRPTSLERSRANRRSGEGRPRSAGGPGSNYGPGSQQMEEVLKYIKQNWDFMTSENCVPVEVALKLMDSSSLGLAGQYRSFQQTHQDMQRALKAIVNEHHQGFNSSIGTFHKIQSSLQSSQVRVRTLKESLTQAKSHLSTTKPELKEFATSSQNYDEMIQVLNIIEQLQLVPDKLEARISEKRFLTAVDILQDALRMIRKSEMEKIGALSELRTYLSNQEHSLTDILLEELHNHLYLKSPYCEDRWKVYAQNQPKGDGAERGQGHARARRLYEFLSDLDTSEPMVDDSQRNPEADTFEYVRLIVESLNKMNRLDIAVDTIHERLPVELYRVVEKSNNEVAQRHPSIIRAYAARKEEKRTVAAESDELRAGVLNDLLWTLYARFEAIAESHRVVYDVVTGIVRRDGIRDSNSTPLTRGFKELWKLFQNEIRSLLHDYLATDGDFGGGRGQGKAASGSAYSRAPRDRNKRMFKLSDMDTKSTELAEERDNLEFILKSSVPGLVSDSKQPEDVSNNASSTLDGSATGHKLLVQPSVFNMGILLPPSLDFLNRLKEVVPSGSDIVISTLHSFLDDFLVNVFLPQLDDTLNELSDKTFVELDAFQEDPQWSQCSKKPIFRGTVKFFNLITAFCKMLDNLPHDQAFSQLIITQMRTYGDKCVGNFKAMMARGQPKGPANELLKACAVYAEFEGEIGEVIGQVFEADADTRAELANTETKLIIGATEEAPLDQQDIIQEKKTIQTLCLLYTSMKWLAAKVSQLRHISNRATDSSKPQISGQRHNRRWTFIAESRTEGTAVYLPLNQETAGQLDMVVDTYRRLATLIHRVLHVNLRLTTMHSLASTIKPSYTLDSPLSDPDPAIQTLTTTLTAYEAEMSTYLPPTQYTQIIAGLAPFTDTYLLHLCIQRIKSMNEDGCRLMQLNILVLQQNLKNIESDANLQYSALYFDLFTEGPEAVTTRAKEHGKGYGVPNGLITEQVVKDLLRLCYGDKLKNERREVGVQAQRQLEAQELEISEYMY
ncbi:exocyst subunit [Paraconiothyrium brasiliense]|uniref:Exocyst complex component Sec8 n=1 Tax=Paraconiothyrium brasiliense TaxID=300254 RepID=A0ABR3RUV9_9PLEO